ncbi:hypothetical protein ACHAXR_006731 [Thalassiosira sp. AJA248-18]
MEDTDGSDDTGDKKQNKKQSSKIIMSNSSRPFLYIGDYDPAKPKPWPKEEKDWWILHDKLTKSVRASDALPPLKFDINESRLPQLIFYGDSITEGWGGTSFGMVPGPHRMWKPEEHKEIRQLFANTFGDLSTWGKRALKPPLVLGISGSRTYDFLWRINNGEFPTSQLLGNKEEEQRQEEGEDDDSIKNRFQLDKLERVYIVLMGTNNLGGGMLPGPTVEGMDAVGRSILQLHKDTFPNTPSAILFSELLPRKDNFRAEKMCPPRCANETTLEPYKSFMPAIDKVNRALPDVVDGWRNDFENSRIVLLTSQKSEPDAKDDVDDEDETAEGEPDNDYTMTINCGRDMFAIEGEDDEFDAYMPDRLHPNAKGYKLWSRCLKRGLDAVMDHTISLEGEK